MGCRRFFVLLVVLLVIGLRIDARGADAPPAMAQNQRELDRLLNIVKKAPQKVLRDQARKELESRGVPMLQVVFVLTLDHWLLEADPIVRYRASAELVRLNTPARIVAAGNLRNLIAGEENPYLKWQHAVALSSIDPEGGSAFELMNQIPDDPILRRTLLPDPNAPPTVVRSDSERSIAEITLLPREYRELSRMLRLEHLGPPGEAPLIDDYASPASTRITSQSPEFLPSPPPPPRKIPAHPLIADRDFDEILNRMDQGSDEAWQLFEWYGTEFPAGKVADRHVPRAYDPDWRVRERSMRALWSAGPDAELAAALIYAVMHDLGIAHHVEMIERIARPGIYSQGVLKQLRGHENPRVRTAVIAAMCRSPEMEEIFVETLRDSIQSEDPEIQQAAVNSLPSLKIDNSLTRPWLEELLLTDEDPELLDSVAGLLKGVPSVREFQQKVFARIDAEKAGERDLILAGYLMAQISAESDKGKQLQAQFQEARYSLEGLRTWQTMTRDLRWIVQEAEAIKRQMNQEVLEQLKKLELLD